MFSKVIAPILFVAASLGLLAALNLGLGGRFQIFALFLILLAAWAAQRFHVRLARARYPDCTDEQFIAALGDLGGSTSSGILRARRQVATELGVRPEMLAPDLLLGQVSRDADFIGSTYAGLDNLEAMLETRSGEQGCSDVGITRMTVAEVALAIARNDRPEGRQTQEGK